ncbi:MAG: hypothetical protein AAGI23_13350, partial [Bacteroidota bacterium]
HGKNGFAYHSEYYHFSSSYYSYSVDILLAFHIISIFPHFSITSDALPTELVNPTIIQTPLFQTRLINGSRYRKLKKVRYGFYFGLLAIGTIITSPATYPTQHPSLAETMGWNFGLIIALLIFIGLIAGLLYLFSIQHEDKGSLTITRTSITFEEENGKMQYNFADIKNLEVRRGATYHLQYQKRSYLHKANNWITFDYGGMQIQREFIINSIEQHTAFEQMIATLMAYRVKVMYLSI